jgi:hypothetical protein
MTTQPGRQATERATPSPDTVDKVKAVPARAGEKLKSAVPDGAGEKLKSLIPDGGGEKATPGVPGGAAAKAGQAQDKGQRFRDSAPMRYLARSGYLSRGVMYVIIGVIAVQAAFGHTGQQADKTGVLQTLGGNPAGDVALWLLTVGFLGMTIWQLSVAAFGTRDDDADDDKKKRAGRRLSAVGKAVVYGALGVNFLEYAIGAGAPKSSDSESVDVTSTLMAHPGGRVLVGLVGAGVVIAGAVIAYQAFREKFREGLTIGQAPHGVERVVVWLGKFGGMARGAVFVVTGVFLVVAAVTAQPGQAKGLDSSLKSLAGTPAGPWLLVVVAVGLLMFGLFSCAQAKWQRL